MFSEPSGKPSNKFVTSLKTCVLTNGYKWPCVNPTSRTVSPEAVIVTSEQSYLPIRAQGIAVIARSSRLINWALLCCKPYRPWYQSSFKAYITAVHRAANCLTSGTDMVPHGTTDLLRVSWSRTLGGSRRRVGWWSKPSLWRMPPKISVESGGKKIRIKFRFIFRS